MGLSASPKPADALAARGGSPHTGEQSGGAASLPASGPVSGERLLELQRARSILVVDVVAWPNGKRSVSLGFCPISDRNPRTMTRYVNVDPHELAAVIGALETARARIEQEQARERG